MVETILRIYRIAPVQRSEAKKGESGLKGYRPDRRPIMTELQLGAGKFKSFYKRDRTITFRTRPAAEWDCMATATGRTGAVVLAHERLTIQINHEGVLDEHGYQGPVCRVHLEIGGD